MHEGSWHCWEKTDRAVEPQLLLRLGLSPGHLPEWQQNNQQEMPARTRGCPSSPAPCEEGLHKAAGAGHQGAWESVGKLGWSQIVPLPYRRFTQTRWRQEGWRQPCQEAAFTSTRSGMMWGLKLSPTCNVTRGAPFSACLPSCIEHRDPGSSSCS